MHQEHFGKKFYQDKKTGYWISTACPKIRAHVWVWNNYHGVVPKEFHIHHKDQDKSNNDILNLNILSVSDHVKTHYALDPSRREKQRKRAAEIRPLTKDWHASSEGVAWHRLHAFKCKFGKNDPIEHICEVCSKKYMTSKLSNARFCSNACKSKWRRDSGLDDIEKICQKCGKKFTSNKYAKLKFCGRECGLSSKLKHIVKV